jgi:hypothetical protein
MKMRSSKTLVFYPGPNKVTACNFLTRSVFECSPEVIGLLASWDKWASTADIARAHGWSKSELKAVVPQLLDFSALVSAGSPLAEQEAQFSGQWNWGLPTALMHFCVQDSEFMTIEQAEERQIERAGHTPQPDLLLKNAPGAIQLPNALEDNELLALMARRRTNRTTATPTITAKQLSDCLFAGLGITGETTNCVGTLPLGMTPSGGARNPYEAYVVALGVDGLEPGVYHYSAADQDFREPSAENLRTGRRAGVGGRHAVPGPALREARSHDVEIRGRQRLSCRADRSRPYRPEHHAGGDQSWSVGMPHRRAQSFGDQAPAWSRSPHRCADLCLDHLDPANMPVFSGPIYQLVGLICSVTRSLSSIR